MSLMNQENIHTFLKGFDTLTLSTTINGLPSLTCLPFETKLDKLDNEIILIRLAKNSVEYNQLLFNKNCCILIGKPNDQLKIYGKARLLSQIELKDVIQEENNISAQMIIEPDQIIHEKDELSTVILDKDLKVTKNLIKANFLSECKFWFRITRAPFFTATVMPVLLGITLAWIINDTVSVSFAVMTLVAGIFIHGGTNLINDFFDQRTDNINDNSTPFSGGSRTIQLRLATQEKILFSALTSFVIGMALVLYMAYIIQSTTLVLILIVGMFLAYFYTAGPIKLSHHGLGEISNFLGYGPILTLAAWLIQIDGKYKTNDLLIVLYWSFIPGLLLTLILLINEFQDFDSDKQAGKRTLVVRMGKDKGKIVYNTVSVLTYVLIGLGIMISFKLYLFGLISLLGFLLFYKATKIINKNINKIEELLPANALTVQNHLLTNLLLMTGFILTKLIFI